MLKFCLCLGSFFKKNKATAFFALPYVFRLYRVRLFLTPLPVAPRSKISMAPPVAQNNASGNRIASPRLRGLPLGVPFITDS